jgi:hypothetical protein
MGHCLKLPLNLAAYQLLGHSTSSTFWVRLSSTRAAAARRIPGANLSWNHIAEPELHNMGRSPRRGSSGYMYGFSRRVKLARRITHGVGTSGRRDRRCAGPEWHLLDPAYLKCVSSLTARIEEHTRQYILVAHHLPLYERHHLSCIILSLCHQIAPPHTEDAGHHHKQGHWVYSNLHQALEDSAHPPEALSYPIPT